VVETLSPGTRKTDETIKRKLYDRFDSSGVCGVTSSRVDSKAC
jgi:hypothetical protein